MVTPPDSGEREVCGCGLKYHPTPLPVTIPHSLARRILAALERESALAAAQGWLDRVAALNALADELRARMPK